MYGIRVTSETTLDEFKSKVKAKVCEKVRIDLSKNSLIMKLLYLDFDQQMDVDDEESWQNYIIEIQSKANVKICVNVGPVVDDDHSEDMNENGYDLNEQVDEECLRGIEDITPAFECNVNSRENVVRTTFVSECTENLTIQNASLGDRGIDESGWGMYADIIRQPLATPEHHSRQCTDTMYNQQHTVMPSQDVHMHGTSRPPYSEQPNGSRGEPVVNGYRTYGHNNIQNSMGTSQQFDYTPPSMPTPNEAGLNIGGSFTRFLEAPLELNVDSADTFRGSGGFNRDRGFHFMPHTPRDEIPPFMPSSMQAGPSVGGSFVSFMTAPLEHNHDTGHTYGMSSINRNNGVHFSSHLTDADIPPCPVAGTFRTEDDGLLFVGKLFKNKADMKMKMSYHALKNDYMWKPHRSDKVRYQLRCFTSEDCEWRVHAVKVVGEREEVSALQVVVYIETHTCGLERVTNDHRQARPGPIGHMVRENLMKLGAKFTTRHLIVEAKRLFNITLEYQRAYHCRKKALELIGDTPELSYCKIPEYFYMLEKENPGTVTDVRIDHVTRRFKYCFMALKASIDGFKFCRPVIIVDGTHLKTKCGGTLLVAVGVDAGDHIFPLAFSVTDGESNEAWMYFMHGLKHVIGNRADLAFVSDRGAGIIHAVGEVFPDAYHGYCYHHLVMNLNKKFGMTGYCRYIFWEAAYTYSKTRFSILFDQLIAQDGDKPEEKKVSTYLRNIGVHRWARAHFKGTRYAIMTSNYVECFNNVIREARKLSIVNLLDYIRATAQKWHWQRRELALSCRTALAPEAEKYMREVCQARRTFTLNPIDQVEFQVGDVDTSEKVNLQTETCYCGEFQGRKMPCVHACAAISYRCGSVYDFCSPYYKFDHFKHIYEGRVYPVPVENDWNCPPGIKNQRILPPEAKRSEGGETQGTGAKKPGRPRTLRFASQGDPSGGRTSMVPNERTEPGSGRKCTLCGNPGHRRPRCPMNTLFSQ